MEKHCDQCRDWDGKDTCSIKVWPFVHCVAQGEDHLSIGNVSLSPTQSQVNHDESDSQEADGWGAKEEEKNIRL